jgi:hypothetical protein
MSKIKQLIEARANRCCEYCLCQVFFCPDPFSIEHIIPVSRGGTDEIDNLAYSCQGCNNHKYTAIEAIDPVSGNMVSLYHPRKDDWETHFKWAQDFSVLVGLTPTGRTTIERLQLNRMGVVNLREVLRKFGKHPIAINQE